MLLLPSGGPHSHLSIALRIKRKGCLSSKQPFLFCIISFVRSDSFVSISSVLSILRAFYFLLKLMRNPLL